jgi:hypothetical protein
VVSQMSIKKINQIYFENTNDKKIKE